MTADVGSLVRTVIADDVEDVRVLVTTILGRDARFEVVGEARDGEEAVEQVLRLRPDLLLLDLSMPRMDGLEVLDRVRREHPGCVVVVLSGFPGDDLAQRCRDAGAAGYLVKGDGFLTLPDRVAAYLDGAAGR